MSDQIQQQIRLPLSKAIEIAWKNIRVRWWRSLLVTSGIVLALSFMTYILCSENITHRVAKHGTTELLSKVSKAGSLEQDGAADQSVQTWWIVGLALLISFVGILNAMLMSVTERFSEIGTMKCLGALDSFIIKLFLLESAFQGMVGTAIGILIGSILAFGEGFARYGFVLLPTLSSVEIIKLIGWVLVTGTLLTVAGALYPAWRAAKMQPVDAMRWEV